MSKFIFLSAMSAFSIFMKGYAGDNLCNYSYGDQKYGKVTVDTIQGNGKIELEGTKVVDLVVVNGSLNAVESNINILQVNGQVQLTNCLVKNTANISGLLNAHNTEFQKELSVASQKIVLKNCSVDSLTVRALNGYDGKQVVELRGKTIVTGPIIVESGDGEIWGFSECEILDQDQIQGAIIIKK